MTEASPVRNPQFVAPAIQISVELIQTVRSHGLTGTEYALWLYLYELAPSGEYTNIPAPHEVAALLNVNPRTIERAAQRLEDLNLFSFQVLSSFQGKIWRTRNEQATVQKAAPPPPPDDFPPDKGTKPSIEGSKATKNDLSAPLPEPLSDKAFEKFSTAKLVPEQIRLNLNKGTDLVKTNTSVPSRIDKEGIGTKFDEICKYIKENGFDPNPAIRATLSKLSTTLNAFDFRKRVDNAISAVQEQIRKGNLKKPTPEPLLNQALIRGFTSNEEKRKARARRKAEAAEIQASQASSPPPIPKAPPRKVQPTLVMEATAAPRCFADTTRVAPPLSPQPIAPAATQIDLIHLSLSIDEALKHDDRPFAFSKLCRLLEAGLDEVVRELLIVRRDWGFRLKWNGSEDYVCDTLAG
jgi:hypothetical protein